MFQNGFVFCLSLFMPVIYLDACFVDNFHLFLEFEVRGLLFCDGCLIYTLGCAGGTSVASTGLVPVCFRGLGLPFSSSRLRLISHDMVALCLLSFFRWLCASHRCFSRVAPSDMCFGLVAFGFWAFSTMAEQILTWFVGPWVFLAAFGSALWWARQSSPMLQVSFGRLGL